MDFFPRRAVEVTAVVLFITKETKAKLDGCPVPAPAIMKHIGADKRHLETTMQALVHAGILKARRGPAGGYLLGRPAEKISTLDLIEALPTSAEEKKSPAIPASIGLAVSGYRTKLAEITIASLLQEKKQDAA